MILIVLRLLVGPEPRRGARRRLTKKLMRLACIEQPTVPSGRYKALSKDIIIETLLSLNFCIWG
jgi:hypothetical protein